MDDWCDLQRTLDDNNKQLWRVVKFLVQTFQRSWGLRKEEKLERGAGKMSVYLHLLQRDGRNFESLLLSKGLLLWRGLREGVGWG